MPVPKVESAADRTGLHILSGRAGAPYIPQNRRRILCIFPRYARSFGTMHHAYPLIPGVKAFMPPQGLLVVAAYLPKQWEVRFVDENKEQATPRDFEWADAVFISGMHVQRAHILEVNRKAHAHGKITVLGGPSVSGCPEWYGEVDLLHCGELGDATDRILSRLDNSTAVPETQEVYITSERLPLDKFPVPAYDKIDLRNYFLASVQFSSGCPYSCEFCDIPELYGRNPRLKTPEQLTHELDVMLSLGQPHAVYFVDDNFVGNQKAALALLDHLVEWQHQRGYPVQFACEATLNLAQSPKLLEKMREACFCTVFCGIETPEEEALAAIHKQQNTRQPILDSVRKLNSYGIEVVSGIIIGLDTDTPTTGDRICQFIEESRIPMLTINMLHALPKTPLWRRLQQQERIVNLPGRDSNVQFLMPYEQVEELWIRCVRKAYQPEAIYDRFEHQIAYTYPNRKSVPAKVRAREVLEGLAVLLRITFRVGILSDYRRRFWRTAWPNLKKGNLEAVISATVISHHLILFARECVAGTAEKCFYHEAPAA